MFIHLVKISHHHEAGKQNLKGFASSDKTAFSSEDCTICDYHLAKDADDITSLLHIVTPLCNKPVFTADPFQQLTSVGLSSSDRGPPVIA